MSNATISENRLPPLLETHFGASDYQERRYERYAAYQRQAPVFRSPEGLHYLVGYDACAAVLSDKALRREPPDGATNLFAVSRESPNALEIMIGHWLIFMDPPRHDVVRSAFVSPFTAKAIARTESSIRAVAERLVDDLRAKPRAELMEDYASPFPILVLCEILGLPTEDRRLLTEWTVRLTDALESGSDDDMRRAVPTGEDMRDYFADFLRAPTAAAKNGPLAHLFAGDEAALRPEEILYGYTFLVVAGYETTKNFMGSAILTLCRHPGEMMRLREQPALFESAIEELLRYESPLQKVSRWTTRPTRFGDYEVPGQTLVTALIGPANRDPAVFPDPHRCDVGRSPNRHLAFGKGLHACLGATLARLETRIALQALLGAFGSIEPRAYAWRRNSAIRGLELLTADLR